MAAYFIHAELGGAIKIGHCGSPAQRASSMQSQHWMRLWLIGAMRGGRTEEMEMHRRFRRHKILGEWFAADKEIFAFIDRLPLIDMAEMFRGFPYGTKYIRKTERTEAARLVSYKMHPPRRWNGNKFEPGPWSARNLFRA